MGKSLNLAENEVKLLTAGLEVEHLDEGYDAQAEDAAIRAANRFRLEVLHLPDASVSAGAFLTRRTNELGQSRST